VLSDNGDCSAITYGHSESREHFVDRDAWPRRCGWQRRVWLRQQWRFDTMAPLQHPLGVVRSGERLAAALMILALCAGNLAVCAGWRATPEARMACCQDETTCPMHKSESRHTDSKHQITQAQADSCCAGSERSDSATTRTAFGSVGIDALVSASVPVVVSPTVPALQEWRAFFPLPVSPVPKHLLLSVLLV
jgi:hypothetical protein